MGGYFIHTISVDGINLWTSCELTPCITYLALSFAVNLVVTIGIIWRLVCIRRKISDGSLGPQVARVYTSVVAMLIESASLYTLVALLAIISCARRIPMEDALLPMLGQLQVRRSVIPLTSVVVTSYAGYSTAHDHPPSDGGPRRDPRNVEQSNPFPKISFSQLHYRRTPYSSQVHDQRQHQSRSFLPTESFLSNLHVPI